MYYDINGVKRLEPRIEYIKKSLEEILKLVDLEYNGETVKVDGFKLKNLNNWIIDNPFSDPAVIYNHCARQCAAKCKFCYLKGNPPDLSISKSKCPADINEILTRIKYYDPENGKALFNSSYEYRETLQYPYIKDVLSEIRKKTSEPFFITTNGAVLNEDMVKYLEEIKPLLLIVSIIVINEGLRNKLVNSPDDHVAINSITLLKKYNIPYVASITMWPDISFEDLERTIEYCDKNNPYYIRIALPGFTKYSFPDEPFETETYWKETIAFVRKIRSKYKSPILIFPPIVEEVMFDENLNEPIISGVISNSLASKLKIQFGDKIKSINGIEISNREHAVKLLSFFDKNNVSNLEIELYRDSEIIKMRIDEKDYKQYTQDFKAFKWSYFYFPYGIILSSGFKENYVSDIDDIMKKNNNVVLFSSKYIRPFLLKYIENKEYYENHRLNIIIPKSNYLGGNIVMGDMMVVSDYIDSLDEYLQNNNKPDLILIPSSSFPDYMWKRDLRGIYYKEIERKYGIKVDLLKCEPIMF